jgi:hypothetical protein
MKKDQPKIKTLEVVQIFIDSKIKAYQKLHYPTISLQKFNLFGSIFKQDQKLAQKNIPEKLRNAAN